MQDTSAFTRNVVNELDVLLSGLPQANKFWSGSMARKMGRAVCIFLLICFAPFLLGLAICLLFFPPTWFVLWLLSKPEFQETYLRIKIITWEECWHIRGAVSPRRFSDAELALQKAVACGDFHTADVLLRRGANVNASPFYGIPLLIVASEDGDTLMVQRLLEAGTQINARYPILRYTALIQAARHGHADAASYLLERGADITGQDVYGRDALLWAVWERYDATVRVLLQRMFQEATLPFNCHLALKIARQQGYGEIVEMLQEGINAQTGSCTR